MAINLRNNVQKQTLPLSNPMASFSNPVDDFLSPFQQTKKDLEGKIAEISSGQAPKSISQDINETNWSQFQGDDPNKPNYQPQSLIDYFRTGKTSSERIASGEIPSRTVPDSENPFKTPVKSSNPYEGAPQFVQDFGNFYFGTNPDDPTTSGLYQALAPNEEKIASMGQVVTDTAENLQTIGQDITATTGEIGNWIQNKAPGLEQAKGEGRYLSQDQVREFLDENKDMSEDQLISAMADLENEGFFFEGYNDENTEGASTIGRSLLGAGVKGIGSMFGMGSEALGGTMEGAGNIAEGETGLGVSQIAGQAPNIAMTAINTVAPGAGAAASTLFSTDTGQAVMEPVMGVSQNITEAGLNLTDLDPNSDEYQNYLKGGTGMLPLVATAGAAKGIKAYAPEIKGAMGRAGEFVQEKAPIVGEAIGKAGEKVSDAMGSVGQKFSKTKEKVNQMIDEDFLQIEQSKKAGFQSNPFQKEYAQGLVEQMKSAEGVADVKTIQTEYVSQLVDKLQPIIKLKEKALSEDSPIYKQIRELPTQVQVAPIIEGFNATLKKNGLGIDETGNVYRMPGTAGKTINQADIAKINQLYSDILSDANAQGGNLSVAQVLDGRKNASKMAKYDASTTTDGTNVIRSMRKDIDTVAKNSIEGLKEIDKNFVDKLESFENATRDLVYRQGEQRGDFISNFNSKIKNLKNDRNSPLRQRLDEIMPDLSARVEAISNLSEIHGALTRNLIRGKFSQAVSGFSGGAFSGAVAGFQFGGILGAAGGFVLGGILGSLADAKLTSFRQNRVIQIVSQTSKAGKARLNVINEKIAKNEALSKADEKFLKDLKEKITRALVKEKIIPKESLKLLSGPSGLDLSAEVVNVNPITAGPSQARQRLLGNTRRKAMSAVSEGINRPTGEVKTKPAEMYGKEAIEFKEKTAAYDKIVIDLKGKIATDTKAARYGGTGNERVETAIKSALDTGKIDMPTAFDIISEIIDDATKGKTDKTYREKYSYIDAPKLDKFLNDLYSGKVEKGPTFDDLLNQKSPSYEAPKKEVTPYQIYDEINRMANDRRYNHETTNAKISEFQKLTGKNPLDVSYQDFSAEGMLKTGEKVVQKQEGTTAVIEKPKTEVKVEQKPEAKRLLPKPKAEEVAKKVEQQSLNIEEKPAVKKEIIPKPKPKVEEVISKKETSEMTVAEKIQAELDAKQAGKEFKDVNERVAGSRKEKALYRKLSMEDYKKVESESAALANDLVTRDRVIQDKYDPKTGKESGDGAGIAFIKDKILSSLTKKPEVGKEFRETFVNDVPDLYQKIADAKSLDELKTIAKETFRIKYSLKGDKVVFLDETKPDATGVFGKKFLDTLMERTDGAKATWIDAEMKEGLTSEGLVMKREAFVEKTASQLEKMKEKFANEDWEAKAKKYMPSNMAHFEYKTGDKFSASEYRNQSPAIVKKIAQYLKDKEQKNIDTFTEWSIKDFESKPKNQVRNHDWSYLADETKTPKTLLPKGEKSDTPTLHGGETIKEVYREGGRSVSADEVSSPEKIKELFGYKSTQFGNYMKDADSVDAVKNFVGAMRDLEDITGINIKKLNEKEGLSIAFGARGSGRFAAHYEPSYNIINLTKGNGNGSVAHEFGHFLDYTAGKILKLTEGGFPKALSKEDPVVRRFFPGRISESGEVANPVLKSMQNLISTIKGEGKKHVKNVKIKPEEGGPTYSRIKTMFNEKGLNETIKTVNETNYKESDKLKIFKYIANLNGGEITVPMIQKGTRYYSDSSILGKKYWGSNVELIARAFEAYIQDLGQEKGIKSNYLVADNNHPVVSRKHGELHTYPLGEERIMINKAFDEFMSVLKENIDK